MKNPSPANPSKFNCSLKLAELRILLRTCELPSELRTIFTNHSAIFFSPWRRAVDDSDLSTRCSISCTGDRQRPGKPCPTRLFTLLVKRMPVGRFPTLGGAERVPFSTSGRRDRPATSFFPRRAEDDTPEKESGLTRRSPTRIKGRSPSLAPSFSKPLLHFLRPLVRNVRDRSTTRATFDELDRAMSRWHKKYRSVIKYIYLTHLHP